MPIELLSERHVWRSTDKGELPRRDASHASFCEAKSSSDFFLLSLKRRLRIKCCPNRTKTHATRRYVSPLTIPISIPSVQTKYLQDSTHGRISLIYWMHNSMVDMNFVSCQHTKINIE
jgi:hypothetical protein